MKKILILLISILLISCVWAQDNSIKINGIEFNLPNKYTGGDEISDGYRLENLFSIRCIDNDTSNTIGLWASESDFKENLNITNHPVRHYYQYNKYVDGNHSHAYFVSGNSVYEISWVGEEINSDIEKLIKDTPSSKISDNKFYNALDESIKLYKQERTDKLNRDGEYNYLESKINSQTKHNNYDDTVIKERLLTYL